jgi:hypothetical protein
MNDKIIENNIDLIKFRHYLRFMKEKQKGGSRKGAGRKPSLDPKQPVTIFVEASIVESFGGKEGVQLFCYNAIDSTKKVVITPTPGVYEGKKIDISEVEDELRFPISKKKALADLTPKVRKEVKDIKMADLTKATATLKPQNQPEIKIQPLIHPDRPMVANKPPRNLDELKALCPYPEKSDERSNWVRLERQKYGI